MEDLPPIYAARLEQGVTSTGPDPRGPSVEFAGGPVYAGELSGPAQKLVRSLEIKIEKLSREIAEYKKQQRVNALLAELEQLGYTDHLED